MSELLPEFVLKIVSSHMAKNDKNGWLRVMIREEIAKALKDEENSSAEIYHDSNMTDEELLHLENTGFLQHNDVWYHPLHWKLFTLNEDWSAMTHDEIDRLPKPDILIHATEFTALSHEAKQLSRDFARDLIDEMHESLCTGIDWKD
jgi:hypothetical protein